MQDRQQQIYSQLDAIDAQLDNLISANDIALANRLKTTVNNFRSKLPKLKRAGFDVGQLEDSLENIDKRLTTFLGEFS